MSRTPTPRLIAAACLLFAALPAARAATPDKADVAEDERLFQEAKLGHDGPALLDFFRKRTLGEADVRQIDEHVRRLGDESFPVRARASAALLVRGVLAVPRLKKALADPDPEVRHRAASCLDQIDVERDLDLTAAAARLLQDRRPDGAPAVLLAYLPSAAGEDVEEEVFGALAALGVRDGKVDAIVAAAVRDKEPARRRAAALVLGRYGSDEQRAAVRALLTDGDAAVRFRAAQGLLAARDEAAVPALIALLAEPTDLAGEALDLLGRAAGDHGPSAPLGDDTPSRRECRDAWAAWWKAKGGQVDLARADVELAAGSSAYRARAAAARFVEAFHKNDKAGLLNATAVPFYVAGERTLATKEELDQLLGELLGYAKTIKIRGEVKGVVRWDEAVRRMRLDEQEALGRLRRSQVRVVLVRVTVDREAANLFFFVRVGGGQAKVVGVGPPEEQEQKGGPPG